MRAASESTGRELWIEAGRVGGGVPDGEQATWSCEGEATALLVLDETNRVVVVPKFDTVLSLDRDNDSADR